jgi:hypothetical protein
MTDPRRRRSGRPVARAGWREPTVERLLLSPGTTFGVAFSVRIPRVKNRRSIGIAAAEEQNADDLAVLVDGPATRAKTAGVQHFYTPAAYAPTTSGQGTRYVPLAADVAGPKGRHDM